MAREIKFRGKQIDNGEWVDGDLFRNFDGRAFVGELVVTDYKGTANDRFDLGIGFDEVDQSTICQYTGLKDKNGKEIYEGDIVKNLSSYLLGKVVYATYQDGFDGMCGFMVDDVDDGLQDCNGFWHQVEVIGNIYENPELLNSMESEVSQ